MTQLQVFNKMQSGINVQITKKFRKDWGKENLGRWFYILSLSNEGIELCSFNHQIFTNVPFNEIR